MKERTRGSWMFPSFIMKLTHFGIFGWHWQWIKHLVSVIQRWNSPFHIVSIIGQCYYPFIILRNIYNKMNKIGEPVSNHEMRIQEKSLTAS